MIRTVLVTGGAGFIGSNFVRCLLRERPHWQVVNLDALTYAGNPENLAEVAANPRYLFERGDVADPQRLEQVFRGQRIDAVVHLAAESHVDRSILEAAQFIRTNVAGTQALLDVARGHGVARFLQVSTDEVYGSLGPSGRFTETSSLAPNSPYSASKAAADLLARAAFHTHGLPVLITRCSNNYGPYQFPEKLIPLMICNALEDKPLPLYGDGRHVRDWLHVEDHCAALLRVLEDGRPGEIYNVGGDCERDNLSLVRTLLAILGKGEDLLRFVEDRPGHDRRYAIDASKLRRELGFSPRHRLEEGLAETVAWYRDHADWVERVRTGAYREHYERWYDRRLGAAAPLLEDSAPPAHEPQRP